MKYKPEDHPPWWTGLSTRATNALVKNDLGNKEQLASFVEEGGLLEHLPFIGPKSRDEILAWLTK